jgi:hypothetical protein
MVGLPGISMTVAFYAIWHGLALPINSPNQTQAEPAKEFRVATG